MDGLFCYTTCTVTRKLPEQVLQIKTQVSFLGLGKDRGSGLSVSFVKVWELCHHVCNNKCLVMLQKQLRSFKKQTALSRIDLCPSITALPDFLLCCCHNYCAPLNLNTLYVVWGLLGEMTDAVVLLERRSHCGFHSRFKFDGIDSHRLNELMKACFCCFNTLLTLLGRLMNRVLCLDSHRGAHISDPMLAWCLIFTVLPMPRCQSNRQ